MLCAKLGHIQFTKNHTQLKNTILLNIVNCVCMCILDANNEKIMGLITRKMIMIELIKMYAFNTEYISSV